jgi:primosomal protein N' (replication factor Y)
VEATLKEAFPEIPVARMDADSTATRGSHHQILAAFQRGESRLLVGTQIVAKGHDFPGVTLAVVLGADHTLMMPDFRAAERSFSLLTQLAGRAGRGSSAGRVLVQTHHPEHFALQCLGDYPKFFEQEANTREVLGYPPFSRLSLVRFEGVNRGDVLFSAREVAERLRGTCDGRSVQVLGPAPAALPRLLGRWRYQIILRGMDASLFRKWVSKAELSPKSRKGVRVVVDVDPRHLM